MAGWKEPAHRLDKKRLVRLFKQLDVHLGIANANRATGATQPGPLTSPNYSPPVWSNGPQGHYSQQPLPLFSLV